MNKEHQLKVSLIICIALIAVLVTYMITHHRNTIFTNDITTIADKTDREIWTEMTKAEKNAYVFAYYVGMNRCWKAYVSVSKEWKEKDMPITRSHAEIVSYVNRECEKGLKKFSMDQDIINAMTGDE